MSDSNVYPDEVEDIVAAQVGMLEVAAIGVPDEKHGEAVGIVVVRKDPELDAEHLLQAAADRLHGVRFRGVSRRVCQDHRRQDSAP